MIIMNARIALAIVTAATLATFGCVPSLKSGRGFVMPTGNAAKGKAAFVGLKCIACHRVDGVEPPAPAEPPKFFVTLGGDVTHVRTYGELVTAIIHPPGERSDKPARGPAKSPDVKPMKNVNGEMTVAQLVDLVTFLQPAYHQVQPIFSANLP